MYSLFDALVAQHARQLTPVRCAEQTIAQLHQYFEDVVLENKLSALVVEGFPFASDRQPRHLARVRDIRRAARNSFFFVSDDDALMSLRDEELNQESVFLALQGEGRLIGHFVVIADARFSALLASPPSDLENEEATSGNEVIWTFDPDIVYSALEYLMARVTAEFPEHSAEFSQAVNRSMPKATSLQLTVSVTTKLARLLQSQAEREIAVNRIATAIRNSLELDCILQTATNEVGSALHASSCAIRVVADSLAGPITKSYFRQSLESDDIEHASLANDLDALGAQLAESPKTSFVDGNNSPTDPVSPWAAVPLNHRGRLIGLLLVRSVDLSRSWADNELLLLHTVADQVTVAINQANLFAQLQQQALTDGLTECHNRRAFDMQLERDLQLAIRLTTPLSLVMLDVDNFKLINDTAGHAVGDRALRMLADTMRAGLRAVDTPARFGGDEFAIILPQADLAGATIVAERLRIKVEQLAVAGTDSMTASFGLASFPLHASSSETLVAAADRALYRAKESGRNCVCVPEEDQTKECTSMTEGTGEIQFPSEEDLRAKRRQ
jgi:diguanylate cyclase (GGDEF)-like protein